MDGLAMGRFYSTMFTDCIVMNFRDLAAETCNDDRATLIRVVQRRRLSSSQV